MDRPLPAYKGEDSYVFVSYSHEDDDLAHPQIRWLQDQGFNVWWDEGISPGAVWRGELADALQGCALIIYLITPNSVRSEQCTREVNFGLDEFHRPVLAIHLVETALPHALGLSLSDRQAILRHELEPGDYERKVLSAVARVLERPVPAMGPSRQPRPSLIPTSRRATLLLAALVGGIVAVVTWFGLRGDLLSPQSADNLPIDQPTIRSTIELHPDAPLAVGGFPPLTGIDSTSFALSPDGRYLAYVGETGDGVTKLFLRNLSESSFAPVPSTDDAIFPFFSPDSQWLGFLTNDKVKKVAVTGGAPVTLMDADSPTFARWLLDDQVYVAGRQGRTMMRTSSGGGAEVSLLDEGFPRNSWITDVLPQGTHVILTTRSSTSVSADRGSVTLLDLATLDLRVLFDSGYGARYLPTGHLVFGRGGDLYAIPFDVETLRVSGTPTRVVGSVTMQSSVSGHHQSAFSANGLLAYAGGGDTAVAAFQWLDRDGNLETIPIEPGTYNFFDLSPDDRRLAVHVADVNDYVRIYDFATGIERKLPVGARAGWPMWSPNGEQVLISMQNGRVLGLSDVDGGAGFTERATGLDRNRFEIGASFWMSTGPVLVTQGAGIFSLPEGSVELEMVVEDEGAWGAEASPDGRWIAYTSHVTGRSEVRISSFPGGNVNRQVSTDGGIEPVWCRACEELFFRSGNRWYASKIRLEPELSIGAPQLAFDVPGFVDTFGRSYDVSRDGQRLLVLRRVNEPTRTKLHLVQNWFAELERLVPSELVKNKQP